VRILSAWWITGRAKQSGCPDFSELAESGSSKHQEVRVMADHKGAGRPCED
jgi:hypothetical protein